MCGPAQRFRKINGGRWRFNKTSFPRLVLNSADLNKSRRRSTRSFRAHAAVKIFGGGSLGLKNTSALRFFAVRAVEMSLLWANYLGRCPGPSVRCCIQGIDRQRLTSWKKHSRHTVTFTKKSFNGGVSFSWLCRHSHAFSVRVLPR